jgi:hypothetical protein
VVITPPPSTSPPAPPVAHGTLTATTLPKVSGKPKVGSTLTVSKGVWSVPGVALKYQWFAGSKAIKGATKTRLKLAKALKGKKVSVAVTATAAGYAAVVVRTKPTGKVT